MDNELIVPDTTIVHTPIGVVQITPPFVQPVIIASQPVNVNVVNTPITVTEVNVDKNFGTWSYYAGSVGTVIVTSGQRVLGIGAHATTAGSFTINGGASIPIPSGVSININPLANLIAPTIIFTGTDSYFIEVVS